MTITALTSTGKLTRSIERPRPLTRVMTWEFRRFCASRLFWLQALGFFCFSLFVTWALHAAPACISRDCASSRRLLLISP